MASYHAISDSDSDVTIDPTDANVLVSDTDSDSGSQRKVTAKKEPPPPRARSLHQISDSDSDDETIIPPTQQEHPPPTKRKKHRPVSPDKKPLSDLFGDDSDAGNANEQKLVDLFGDDSDGAPDGLGDVTSTVQGASLGRKLSRDPSVIQQWAGGGQGSKRHHGEDTEMRPACKHGRLCILKSKSHFEEYSHPESVAPKDEWQSMKKKRCLNASQDPSCSKTTFSFFLSKVQGIPDKYNGAHSMDIKDILSPSMGNLQRSAQFSYVFDIPWLVHQYPPSFRKLPLTVVHGFQRQEKKALEGEARPFSHVTLCRAKLEILYGTHHTKMMLLHYDNGMRVVITTANLIAKDWAQKTQGMWMSPLFPRLPQESATAGDSLTHFKRDLLQYLGVYADPAMEEWRAAVRQHDMSATRVFLIASVPGRHKGLERASFGHLKLQKVLSDHGPRSDAVKDWPVVAQFSSVGSLGSSPEAWLTGEFRASLASTQGAKGLQKPELKLIYPSKANVRESLEGYPAGASLPYSINTASKQTWLHTFWHHWYAEVRGRSPASPHIKTYLRSDPDWKQLAWFLVTSANLSKAAWGALEKSGSQLMIRSYELGVLFVPEQFGLRTFEALRSDTSDPASQSVFPMPYDLPPTHYDIKIDRPWVWDIPYVDKADRHGNKWCPT